MRIRLANADWKLAGTVGLLLALTGVLPLQAADCDAPPTGLVPLTELGTGTFEGVQGGLYPDGENQIPLEHMIEGRRAAESIAPRDGSGQPDPVNGKIVVVSIGVSNTQLEFRAFTEEVEANGEVDPQVTLVNGAQFGRALGQWASRQSDSTWATLDQNLAEEGMTPAQVQVAWIKLPSRSRGPASIQEARDSVEFLTRVLQVARERYPNLAVAYLSSRTYGGYIPDSDSEPNAYLHGFEVKFVIEAQIEGATDLNSDPQDGPQLAPWIAWGPYLWADGTNPRADGLSWTCSDFRDDGVHPADSGQRKVASLLWEHFSTDPVSSAWFLADNAETGSTEPPPTSLPPATTTVEAGDGDETQERPRKPDRSPNDRDRATVRQDAASPGDSDPPEGRPGPIPLPEFGGGLVIGLVAGGIVVWSKRRHS